MRLTHLFTHEAGPLGSNELKFSDPWNSKPSTRVLVSGPNGCGKSTVLRGIATLWSAFGHWLQQRDKLEKSSPERAWLQRWSGFGMRLEGLPGTSSALLLVFGEPSWCEALSARFPDACLVGETVLRTGKVGAPAREFLWPERGAHYQWLDTWTPEIQKLVTMGSSSSPNLIFLDAEERRWVIARQNVGKLSQADLSQLWLVKYQANEQWSSQLEAGLINLKLASPESFDRLIDDMNGFLHGKNIQKDVKLGENRLRVKLPDSSHFLDELSAGERQVLILLFIVGSRMQQGGIVLVDEPDLHLHPSLVPRMLDQLEKMVVKDRVGQLFVTSHAPEVWQRYEAVGQRVLLEARP